MAGYEWIYEYEDKVEIHKFKTKDALIDFLVYIKLGESRWRKV